MLEYDDIEDAAEKLARIRNAMESPVDDGVKVSLIEKVLDE